MRRPLCVWIELATTLFFFFSFLFSSFLWWPRFVRDLADMEAAVNAYRKCGIRAYIAP